MHMIFSFTMIPDFLALNPLFLCICQIFLEMIEVWMIRPMFESKRMNLFQTKINLNHLKETHPHWSTGVKKLGLLQSPYVSLEKILLFIQEIPYGRPSSNTPCAILQECKGTCSGKHLVAKEVLDFIGQPSKLMMACYRVSESNKPIFIEDISEDFWDVHNYIRIPNSQIIIDLTWPNACRSLGLVSTLQCDETFGFNLVVDDIKEERQITADAQGLEQKKLWLKELNNRSQFMARETFIEDLSNILKTRA